jgi:hypothetical protein
MTDTRITVDRSSPSLGRVTFHNPPINLIDSVMIRHRTKPRRVCGTVHKNRGVAGVHQPKRRQLGPLIRYGICPQTQAARRAPTP